MVADVLSILLVEDSPQQALLLRRTVEDSSPGAQPLSVTHVSTIAAAGTRLMYRDIDAVLLDLGLPDSNGIDTLIRLRALAPDVPVVVLTGVDDDALGVRAIREGAYEYLVKGQLDGRAIARTLRHAVEQQKASEALRRSEERTLQSQKMEAVGRLAGGIAHDFNNLLTAMIGYAELVKDALPPGSAAMGDINEVLSAANRAASLTRQLLAFGRRQMLMPEVLSLGAVTLATQGMLRPLIGEDIDLMVRHQPGVPPISADRGQIERVLMDLAVNARDAMPNGGVLTIEVGTGECPELGDDGPLAVVLTVSDTGYGMDAKTLARIFEPFYTTKERGKGTGLGLSTVYGIVRQSGGHIEAASQPGRGTTFRMCFRPADEKSAFRSGASVLSSGNG